MEIILFKLGTGVSIALMLLFIHLLGKQPERDRQKSEEDRKAA